MHLLVCLDISQAYFDSFNFMPLMEWVVVHQTSSFGGWVHFACIFHPWHFCSPAKKVFKLQVLWNLENCCQWGWTLRYQWINEGKTVWHSQRKDYIKIKWPGRSRSRFTHGVGHFSGIFSPATFSQPPENCPLSIRRSVGCRGRSAMGERNVPLCKFQWI